MPGDRGLGATEKTTLLMTLQDDHKDLSLWRRSGQARGSRRSVERKRRREGSEERREGGGGERRERNAGGVKRFLKGATICCSRRGGRSSGEETHDHTHWLLILVLTGPTPVLYYCQRLTGEVCVCVCV